MIPADLPAALYQAQRLLNEGERAPTGQLAGISLILARLHTQVGEALEPLKEALRARASEGRNPETQTVTITGEWAGGTQGTVAVTFPAAGLRLSPKTDAALLKARLGPVAFGRYFEEVVTYQVRKDFGAQLAAQSVSNAAEIEVVLAAVENTKNTPRVAFRTASVQVSSEGGGFQDLDPDTP